MPVGADQIVDEVMRRWPATIQVFLGHRTRCVGCPIACFHTVKDASREHGLEPARFLDDLRSAAAGPGEPQKIYYPEGLIRPDLRREAEACAARE